MSRSVWRLKSWAKAILATSILACPFIVQTDQAHAIAVGVNSSSYTITHMSGFGQTDGLGPKEIPTWPPVIEYDNTLTSGLNSSRGRGGAGTLVLDFLVGLGFPAGTGIQQDWILGDHQAASLRIDFNVIYDIVGGFGPPTASFANFTLGGVVSDGGWVSFAYEAVFTGIPGGILGGALSGSYYNDTPGVFTGAQLSEFNVNGNGVPGDGLIDLTGYILFEAFDGANHDSSSIAFTRRSGILPPIPLPGAGLLLLPSLFAFLLIRRQRGDTI